MNANYKPKNLNVNITLSILYFTLHERRFRHGTRAARLISPIRFSVHRLISIGGTIKSYTRTHNNVSVLTEIVLFRIIYCCTFLLFKFETILFVYRIYCGRNFIVCINLLGG